MSRGVPIPFFPSPPPEYNRAYLAQLVRNFAVYTEQMNTPGPFRATELTLTNLQSGNDVGLEVGAVFEVDGYLKISRLFNPHVAGASATGAVGSVIVVTP
jgi:hypothetical protein